MKDNKKVFIMIKTGEYEEITYSDFKKRCERYISYSNKMLYPFKDGLLEVTSEDYKEFYKSKRRIKYLREEARENGEVSLDQLCSEEFNGTDILIDPKEIVEDDAIKSVMIKQMRKSIKLLSKTEQALIFFHYYLKVSEPKLALMYSVSQSTISRRLHKVIEKLKKLMKI